MRRAFAVAVERGLWRASHALAVWRGELAAAAVLDALHKVGLRGRRNAGAVFITELQRDHGWLW